MNFKKLLLLLSVISIFACSNTGREGEWKKFKYKWGDNKLVNKVEIIVQGSYYCAQGFFNYENIIRVQWQAKNLGNSTTSYRYLDKYLIDKAGRKYKPYDGFGSDDIHPLVKSKILVCMYVIPSTVKIRDLSWGLYNNDIDKVYYKIKLRPTKKNLSEIIIY
jgi:hypothetical protein